MPFKKGTPKTGGRQKGTPNKIPAELKDQILEAAKQAGGEEETVGYLKKQAIDNPGPFMGLLGKVLPLTVQGSGKNGAFLIGWLDDSDSEDPVPPPGPV
jgi:hypothetical protein